MILAAKLSVRSGAGWAPHAAAPAFQREPEGAGPARLVVAPGPAPVALLLALSRTLPGPFQLVYVLLSMRTLRPPGRYVAARPLARPELEAFLARFGPFLEQDGRHHLWIGAADEPSTLVYDHHDRLHLYGRLDRYEAVLRQAGLSEGPVAVPPEHRHQCHDALDALEQELLAARDWSWNPLEPEDEEIE